MSLKRETGAPFCIPLVRGGSLATPLPWFVDLGTPFIASTA
jgi:hypothetical protein